MSGADEILQKPFQMQDMLEMIRNVIDSEKLTDKGESNRKLR